MRPEVRVGVERVVAARPVLAGMSPLMSRWKSRTRVPSIGVVGAVDGHEDRRQRPLDPRRGVGEEHRVVEHALAEFGEHVLQHGRARADEIHPVVAEVAPDQRLRAQAAGRPAAAGTAPASSVMWNSVTEFRTLYQPRVSGSLRARTDDREPECRVAACRSGEFRRDAPASQPRHTEHGQHAGHRGQQQRQRQQRRAVDQRRGPGFAVEDRGHIDRRDRRPASSARNRPQRRRPAAVR